MASSAHAAMPDAKTRAAWLEAMTAAATIAATGVLVGYRTRPETKTKTNASDLVTRYDKESEALLRAALAPLGLPIVGEEAGGVPEPLTLYVDPLDGTTNFVHGHPFFGVSVGLLADGVPLLGVVVAPALGITWTGDAVGKEARRTWTAPGSASTATAERCAVSLVARLDEALLATGFPYNRANDADNNFDAFVALKQQCQAIRRCGSAAIDLCLVADGTYEGYWERRLNPWDLAAGAAMVVASGGAISSFGGGVPDLRRGEVVASNGHLHDELLLELSKVPSLARRS